MTYARQSYEKPKDPHPLEVEFGHHRQLSTKADTGWAYHNVEELMNDGRFALHQLKDTIDQVGKLDLSEFKDEIAAQKRREPVHKARQALLTFFKKHLDGAKADVARVREAILRVTEPKTEKDGTKALIQELRFQEIRNVIRNVEPKLRGDVIRDNPDYLAACVGAPDDLVDKDHLTELRREFAFRVDPSLRDLETDTRHTYEHIRKRAAEINATSVAMLIEAKLEDPVTPVEHFEVFTPETPYEIGLAAKRVQSYQREQERAAKQKEFEEKNPGVNFVPQGRVRRK